MNPLRLSLLAVCVAVATAPLSAQIVINELTYDTSSTDTLEFVELYNAGSAPVDISGWRLDANDENTPNASYTIPSGTTLQPGAFWVLGPAAVLNVNQVVGTQNLWQNSMESLELIDAGNTLVDAVVYEVNKQTWTISAALRAQVAEGLWGNCQSTDGLPSSWSRYTDGYDTDNNGRDFRYITATPGVTNNQNPNIPYIETFDSFTVGIPAPLWGASYVHATVIDPTSSNGGNPMLIPASPQGGNALQCYDSAGGGNVAMLETAPLKNVVLECWAYFDATPEASGEYESWTIGVQGSVPALYNHPPLTATTTGFTANGTTGVCLVYQNDEFGGMLGLIDNNDGGWGGGALSNSRLLASIPIAAGINDGWQRLRLHVGDGIAEAYFGGTYGLLDGTRLAGRIEPGAIGGIYIGYREFLANNNWQPLTFDFMTVFPGSSNVEFVGQATPHTTGTPLISAGGLPNIGDPNFSLDVSGLLPNAAAVMVIGFIDHNPALNLETIGAQPGSRLYVNGNISLGLGTSATGDLSVPLAVPNTPALSGASLWTQVFQADTGLTFALPICQTEAAKSTFGN